MQQRVERFFSLASSILDNPIFDPFVNESADLDSDEVRGEYHFAVPGRGKEDVSVKRKGQKLFIYVDGEMKKRLFLPKAIDTESIKVSVEKGVLTIKYDRAIGGEAEEIEID